MRLRITREKEGTCYNQDGDALGWGIAGSGKVIPKQMEDSTSSVWHAGRGAGRQKKEEDQLADEEGEDRHIGSQGPGPMSDR